MTRSERRKSTVVLLKRPEQNSEVSQLIKEGRLAEAYLAVCTGAEATEEEKQILKDSVENACKRTSTSERIQRLYND
jgi:hypothetical protein